MVTIFSRTRLGVETRDQLAFLSRNRCDTGQGYLFSRPVPAAEFRDLAAAGVPIADAAWAGIRRA